MPTSLAEHMREARHERFVGREEERALFRRALCAEALPFHLLYVYGPGGVGKTALLEEWRYLCEDAGLDPHGPSGSDPSGSGPSGSDLSGNGASAGPAVPACYLDARDVEPTPAAFRQALDDRAGARLEDPGARSVLMIDTFETLSPLERWFREEFLPGRSPEMLLVVAGRTPPPAAWRGKAGLQALMREVPLRNLPPAESRRYLSRRGVPEDQREAVADFACGHPLALSLAADRFDQRPSSSFVPEEAPDLVTTLARRFIEDVPSPAHRRALWACALVRTLSEPLLEHLLGTTGADEEAGEREARALFEWLRGLSFVEAGPRGLFPHDLAREVLGADLRWRRPEHHKALVQAARRFYTERLRRAADDEAADRAHRDALSDYLFLHRDNPVVKPLFARLRRQWEGRAFTAGALREEDEPALRAMTRHHEGEASAALLDHWKGHPAAHVTVFRDGEGEPAGFSLRLSLRDVTEEDRARDSAVEAACRHLETSAPLREGETATLFRYWMDREEHQALSPVQSLIAARRVRHYLATPALAFSAIACAAPEEWALVFAYADMERLEDAGFSVGGQSFALFGHDWRATPPGVWLDRMAERSFTEQPPEEVPPASPAPRLVLSREDFAGAVKEAIKNMNRPGRLRENPLARAALTDGADGREARAERLRALIREAAEQLRGAPKEEKYHRALEVAYLDPVGTQRDAAEATDVAFSTFRRHLARGIEHVTEVLWERETGRARSRGTAPSDKKAPK